MSNKPTTILVVEDAPEFQAMIAFALDNELAYEVHTCADGREAVALARSLDPDLIILDVGLPSLDGVAACAEIRRFSDAYVIMLSARTDEVDRVLGLSIGADDYMTKPFSTRELLARVQALLRRPRARLVETSTPDGGDDVVDVGGVHLDRGARIVSIDGESVELTKIEFDILETMMSRPGMVFSRQLLMETVWGEDWFSDDHVVSVHIANIRRKLDRRGRSNIATVRGVGYRFDSVSPS